MRIKFSTTVRNAMLDSIESTIGVAPVFKWGWQRDNTDLIVSEVPSDTVIATIQMPDFMFAPAEYTGISMSSMIRPAVSIDYSRFPHSCPRCKAPAYIGLFNVECSQERCR